jgi:hypothetical protein
MRQTGDLLQRLGPGVYAFGGLILIINRSLTRVILAPISPNSVAILKNRPRRHQNRVQFSGVVLSPVIHRNGQGCGLFRASYFSMVNQSAGVLLLTALLRIIQQDDKRA